MTNKKNMKMYNTRINNMHNMQNLNNMNKTKYSGIKVKLDLLSNTKPSYPSLFRIFIRYKTSILFLYNYIPFIMENYFLFDTLIKLNNDIK